MTGTVSARRAPPLNPPGPEELLDWAAVWFDVGFRYLHPLYGSLAPFDGYQEHSAKDLDDLRVLLGDPAACGLGYSVGRKCIHGRNDWGRRCHDDLIVFDLDDREIGLAQYNDWVRSVQEEWNTHHQRAKVILSFPEYFGPDGVLLPPPPTLSFGTPSGSLQTVYRCDFMRDGWIVGQRLGTALEVKGASADGKPVSCRLPPTVRLARGEKPAGRYIEFPGAPREVVRLPCPYVIRLQASSDAARRKRAKSTEPPQADGRYVVTPYAREQALRRVAHAADTIENFEQRHGRRGPINGQSLSAGKLGWAFTPAEQEASIRVLIAAAVSIGWSRAKAEETVRTAWNDGLANPEDVRRSTFWQPAQAPVAGEGS